jgi:Leucine-rich repeat (LRR) protein
MMKAPKLDGAFDFEAVAKSKGYLKARLILKQLTADSKEREISKAGINDPYLVIREKLKAKDDLKLSRTIGLTSSESHLEKILALGTKNSVILNSLEKTVKAEETDSCFHSTLLSEDGALFMANTVQTCIPTAFGDTLALQTSFMKIIKCPGNQFKYLTPKLIPQLSTYHMRYVQDINLSNNKLRNMPSEIGNLIHLHTMDLSGNMLSELPTSIVKLKVLFDK